MKVYFHFLPAILLTVIFSSCGTFRQYEKSSVRTQGDLILSEADMTSSTANQELIQNRKIVYSASMDMKVKEPDTIAARINALAKVYKGYVATTGTHSVVIRVPTDRFEDVLTEINLIGVVESKIIKGNDVTEQYLDLEIRLDNAQKARKRYLQLLEKSENVGEALKVEKELERVSKEIDLLKGKINRLSNLTTFATITVNFINVEEQPKPGPIGYIFVGLYKGIKWLFVRN